MFRPENTRVTQHPSPKQRYSDLSINNINRKTKGAQVLRNSFSKIKGCGVYYSEILALLHGADE